MPRNHTAPAYEEKTSSKDKSTKDIKRNIETERERTEHKIKMKFDYLLGMIFPLLTTDNTEMVLREIIDRTSDMR